MKVSQPRLANGLTMEERKRHSPEQVAKKLRDADALLAAATTGLLGGLAGAAWQTIVEVIGRCSVVATSSQHGQSTQTYRIAS